MSEFAPMRQSMSQNNAKHSFQTQQYTPHSQGRSSEYGRRQSRGNLSQHNANSNEPSLEYVYRKKVPMQTKRQLSPYKGSQHSNQYQSQRPTLKARHPMEDIDMPKSSHKTRLSDLSGAEIKDNVSG